MKFKSFIVLAVLFLNFTFFLAFDSAQSVPDLGEAPGTIEFIGDAGSPNKMTFEKWNFTKASMENDAVENLHLLAEIDIRSIEGEWTDLVKSIKKKKDYFDVSNFPIAKVEVNGAKLQKDGSYKTDVLLTLKKFSKPVPVRFTISETKPYVVSGQCEIKRKQFGFTGGGPKPIVPVTFEATLPID